MYEATLKDLAFKFRS